MVPDKGDGGNNGFSGCTLMDRKGRIYEATLPGKERASHMMGRITMIY